MIKKNITILLVSNSFSGGGAEQVAFQTYKMLDKREDINLLTASCDDESSLVLSNSKVSNYLINLFNFKNFFIFINFLIKNKPDVIHIHNYLSNISISIILSIKFYKLFNRLRVFQTLHDHHVVCPNSSLYDDHAKNRCKECVGNTKFRVITKRCYKNSMIGSIFKYIRHFLLTKVFRIKNVIDVFLCPSLFIADILREDGYSSDKLVIVRNPISSDFLINNTILVNGDNSNDLLFLGRLERIKGVDILLKALVKVKALNLILHICGQGSEEVTLKQLTSDLGISKNVIFHGRKSHEEISIIASDCKILILPSIVYENAPLVVYESVKLGLYPIVSGIGGMKEAISTLDFGTEFLAGNATSLSEVIKSITDNYVKGSSHKYSEALVLTNKLCSMDGYSHTLNKIYRGDST